MRAIAIIAGFLCAAAPAWASLVLYEGFDYTPGQAVTGRNGASNGETWMQAAKADRVNSISVASGGLTPPAELQPAAGNAAQVNGWGNSTSSGAADRLAFGTGQAITSGTMFYSLLLRVDALTDSNTTSGGFFLAFNNSTGAQTTTPTTAGARLQCRIDPADGSKFDLGIFNNRSTQIAASTSWAGSAYTVGETLFIVGSYELNVGPNNDVSRLWVNPGDLGAVTAPTPTAIDTTYAATELGQIASILLRQSPAPWATIDELRVGTSWAEVTPEPASLVLMALGGLALLRRRA